MNVREVSKIRIILNLGEGGTWVNFFWVFVAGLSEPLPHYSLFCESEE